MITMLPIARRTKALIEHSMEHFNSGSEPDLQLALLHADNSVEILLKYYLRFSKKLPPNKVDSMNFYELITNSTDLETISKSDAYFLVYHDMRNAVWHDGLMIPPKSDVNSATNYAMTLFNELFPDVSFSNVQTTVPTPESIKNLRSTYGNSDYLSEISDLQRFIKIFERQGYNVIREHDSKDVGIDIIARKKTHSILCEFKTGKSSNIGSHIIVRTNNSFQNYINYSGWDNVEKWLITDAPHEKPAIEKANEMNIRLIKTSDIIFELKRLDDKYRNRDSIKELFEKFLTLNNFTAGEGLVEKSLDSWIDERRRAKAHYRTIFHKNNIQQMKKEDFIGFLYFRNNRAWTNLYRQGLQLVDKFEKVKTAIRHLQDESLKIENRLNDVLLGGDLHVNGFGKNTATGILHIIDETDSYGVWNNVTEKGLEILSKKPRLSLSNLGMSYSRINNELLELKEKLDTDLVIIDAFMWYLTNYHSDESG